MEFLEFDLFSILSTISQFVGGIPPVHPTHQMYAKASTRTGTMSKNAMYTDFRGLSLSFRDLHTRLVIS